MCDCETIRIDKIVDQSAFALLVTVLVTFGSTQGQVASLHEVRTVQQRRINEISTETSALIVH